MSERVAEIEQQRKWTNLTRIPYENNRTSEAILLQQKHEAELLALKWTYETKKQWIREETWELINKEKVIHQSKELLYYALWIDNELTKNGSIQNFVKWAIDWVLVWNIELAIEIINTKWKVLIDWFKQLMSTEWIKQLYEIMKTNVKELLSWNAYEKWKSSSELVFSAFAWYWAFKWIKSLANIWVKATKWVIKGSQELAEKWAIILSDLRTLSTEQILKLPKELKMKAIWLADDTKRIEIAKKLVWWEIWEAKELAIIEAHKVWMNRVWAWIWTYNLWEIVRKWKKLLQAWFDSDNTRILMESWVCWLIQESQNPGLIWRLVSAIDWKKWWTWDVVKSGTTKVRDQLWVIPTIVEKNLVEVNRLFKWEAEIISRSQDTLRRMIDWIDVAERNVTGINKKVNEWLWIRLNNLEKIITYVEDANLSTVSKYELVWATNHLRKELIAKWLAPLWRAIKEQLDLWNIAINYLNKWKMTELIRRIRAVESYTIN